MVDITEAAPGIACIDDNICGIPRLHSVYLIDAPHKAIIDSGPASAATEVLDGIRQAGTDPADVEFIVVTHIHLDHAGGAGTLLEQMPRARVVVHRRGARHLRQMERLVASAVAAQGESVIRQYGTSLPVAADDIIEVGEGDSLDLGNGQALEFMDTPGHAPHELCIRETRHGGIFVGDALGLLLGNHSSLFVSHPPPSYDPAACLETAERLRRKNASRLYFAHFGVTAAVEMVLEQAVIRVRQLDAMIEAAYQAGRENEIDAALAQAFREELEGIDDSSLARHAVENLVPPSANGMREYYRRKYGR